MNRNSGWYVLGAIVVVALVLGGCYNGLVTADVGAKNALGDMHSDYERQAEMLRLNEPVVRGATRLTQDVVDGMVNQAAALNQGLPSDAFGNALMPTTAEGVAELEARHAAFDAAITPLLVYVADNPESLGESPQFTDFMVQIEGGENRKNVGRKRYNGRAAKFEGKCRSFPTFMVAGAMGFDCYKWPQFVSQAGLVSPDTPDFEDLFE